MMPIVWTIAGTDSGGGAGIAADQRAADACGVHLCTVVAAVTAQNSVQVARVVPLSVDVLNAQMEVLASDMPPAVVKTGLLGGAAQVECVAQWIDRLRQRGPVALVVDPVLGASTGGSFADAGTLAAYREMLLPRATLLTPNRREALRLLDEAPVSTGSDVPRLAARLRALGVAAVCITGGDDAGLHADLALDWMDTPQASGWLALPRIATPHHHGTGCTFATSAAAAIARGFVAADALVLAKMATADALRRASPAGAGAGPVRAAPGFVADPRCMPQLSWSVAPRFASFEGANRPSAPIGIYAIVDRAARIPALLAAGVRTVQLRVKRPPGLEDEAWTSLLRAELKAALDVCAAAGMRLIVNDHHTVAVEAGATALHLGQEDLLALDDAGRDALRAPNAPKLGISSHSLWELARARSLAPAYIACGPVWPTTTKDMPWRPQGLDNLAWWSRTAGAPVVAIGGILRPEQARDAVRSGADGVCLVRALDTDPDAALAAFGAAMADGAALGPLPAPDWPHSSL